MTNALAKKLQGFATLSDRDMAMLDAACGNTRTVQARHDLIREGDKPGPVIVVLEGWACRYKLLPDGSRQIMAFLMPGDFCDLHIETLEEMDHSIGTLTTCRITTISREKMDGMLGAMPNLTRAFWRAQLVDESVLRAWIVSMGRRNSLKRVAHLMLELYARMRNIGLTDDDTCGMPLSQTVLADALGLTPVHINRVLRILRERKVMALGSSTLTLLNAAELVAIAGFDENYLHRRIKRAA